MNILLDTHVVLWWLSDAPELSPRARGAIADPLNTIFLSVATIWECRIKQSLRKLELPRNFKEILDDQPFRSLPILAEHAHSVAKLPDHHRDPFDRILIAQAISESFSIATHDSIFARYDVSLVPHSTSC